MEDSKDVHDDIFHKDGLIIVSSITAYSGKLILSKASVLPTSPMISLQMLLIIHANDDVVNFWLSIDKCQGCSANGYSLVFSNLHDIASQEV